MVDFFLLIMLTGAGDELQGMKRGVMELAEVVVINKADGANRDRCGKSADRGADRIALFPSFPLRLDAARLTCSAQTGMGISEL